MSRLTPDLPASRWTFPTPQNLDLLDAIESPVWVFDVERHCIWWANQAALRFWRADSLQDLLARDFGSDSSTVRRRLRLVVENGTKGQSTHESWTLYPNDAPISVDLRLTPVHIGSNHRDALIMHATVSDRDLGGADKQLIEATRYTSIMISYFTLDGDLISMNPAAAEAFALTAMDAHDTARPTFQARFANPSEANALLERSDDGEEPAGEYRILTSLGVRWHRVNLHRGRDPLTGAPVVIVVEENISSLKQAVRDLEYLNQTLEQKVTERTTALVEATNRAEDANRAKSDFLARMSHDLRTPLNAILGFSDILSSDITRDLAEQRYREYGDDINSAAKNLLALVNDLLDLSRIEADQYPVQQEPVALVPMAQETLAYFRHDIERTDISVEFSPSFEMSVLTDRRALAQILSNLVSNSLKYTRTPGRVSVTLEPSADPARALLTIADTGPGIPPEDLTNIFEPYFRGGADVAHGTQGTGLGLAICKRLAELIDVDLRIRSNVATGTSVTLSIPRTMAETSPLVAAETPPASLRANG